MPARLPPPLDSATPYWSRTAQLYAALSQYRHALVHRRITLESNGDLTGTDAAGAPLLPISTSKQDALSRHAVTLSDALVAATASKRLMNSMAWDLDALDSLHDGGRIGATQPAAIIVKVIDDLQPGHSGSWILDGHRLHVHLREQSLRPLDADAEVHAIFDGRDRIYEAHLDDVPDAAIDVDLACLPSWLRCV